MHILIPHFSEFKKEQEHFERMKEEHEHLFKKEYDDFANTLCKLFKKLKISYGTKRRSSYDWFKIDFSIEKERFQIIASNGTITLETYIDDEPGFQTTGTVNPHGILIQRWRKFEKFQKEFIASAEKFKKKN